MSQTPDKNTPATASDDAQNIAADVDEVMRKYDRESNTRIWTGVPELVIRIMLALFSLFMVWMNLFACPASWALSCSRASSISPPASTM